MRLQTVEPPKEWGKDLGDPVAVLRVEPDQLTRELGLAFVRGYDDLDHVRVATVSLNGSRPIFLVRHEGKPQGGTEIVAPGRLSRDISDWLGRLLQALHLGPRDVAWTHPQVSQTAARRSERKPSRSALVRGTSVRRKSRVRSSAARKK